MPNQPRWIPIKKKVVHVQWVDSASQVYMSQLQIKPFSFQLIDMPPFDSKDHLKWDLIYISVDVTVSD